jgi:pyruvate kinase
VGNFNPGEILVVSSTNADFVDLIRKAGGIITEDESLSSHAAIIGLRLGVPVIVGLRNATKIIRDGAILTLDTHRGLVYSGAMSASSPSGAVTV